VSAYIVFIRDKLKDAKVFQEYAAKAGAAREGHSYRPIVAYGEIETLEGDPADGAVILEFPTVEAARAWYFSDKYQEAKAIRKDAGDYRAVLVKGL